METNSLDKIINKKKEKLNEEQLKAQWNKIKKLEGKRDETYNPFSEINPYLPLMLKTIEIGNNRYKSDRVI